MSPSATSTVVQQIILLAMGIPASVKLRSEISDLYEAAGDWQSVAVVVDAYMNNQVPLTRNGISGLVQAMASNALGLRLSDNEAAQVTHDFMDRGINTWSKLFMFVISELTGEPRQVLDQRATAAENFTDLLENIDKDSDYHGISIHSVVREWMQGIGASNASLQAAEQSAAELIARFSDNTISGTVLDGYISGATVFIDENGDGILGAGEYSTTTNVAGVFSFVDDVPRGQYFAIGGIDWATGKPFAGRLMAPEGAVVMTPLTTLISVMLRNDQTLSIDIAEGLLFKGFDVPRVDLSVFDPIASSLYGTTLEQKVAAVKIQSIVTQVVNLLNVVQPLLDTLVPSYFRVEQFILNTLSAHLVTSASTNNWLDLSNKQTLMAIIKDTLIAMGIIDADSPPEKIELADTLIGQAAELLRGMNALVQETASQFEDGRISNALTSLSDMVKVQTLVQTDVALAAVESLPSGSLENIVNQFAPNNLATVLDKIETGFLDSQTPVNDGSALTNPVSPTGNRHAPQVFDEFFLNFDGINDYIQIGNNSNLEMTATMAMEAWIKPNSSSNVNQMIINKEGEYEVGLFPDGTIRWAFSNTDPGWTWYDTGHVVSANEWTHIAVSYDNGVVKTYAEGTLVHTYNGSGVIGDAHPVLDDLRIGGRSNNPPGKYFDGLIGEVRIWSIVRTGAEISANYNQYLSGSETGLAGNWRLNEGAGTWVDDISPLNNDGALGGAVAAQEPGWEGYATQEESSLNVPSLLGVLSNDFDDAGHTLTATLVSNTRHGTLSLNPNGSFTYTPDANFFGIDSFRYKASDGIRGENGDTVRINVSNVNDAPVISSDGGAASANLTVNENATLVTTVIAGDIDIGDTLSYSISGGNDLVLFNIDANSGALSFASAPDFETPLDANHDNIYEITIQTDDGQGGVDTQILLVTVHDIFGF